MRRTLAVVVLVGFLVAAWLAGRAARHGWVERGYVVPLAGLIVPIILWQTKKLNYRLWA